MSKNEDFRVVRDAAEMATRNLAGSGAGVAYAELHDGEGKAQGIVLVSLEAKYVPEIVKFVESLGGVQMRRGVH